MTSTWRERELKLAVAPGVELPDLAEAVPGLTAEAAEPRRLVTVHWDAEDLRLARWGCSLRHRVGEGWTVKLPVAASHGRGSAGLVVRDEHLVAGGPGRPPAAALDLLRGYLRTAVPASVLRLVTVRRPVRLGDGEGRALLEVDDDEVSVHSGRRLVTRFREVEVELLAEDGEAAEAALAAVVGRLRSCGAAPDPTPKLVRALGNRAAAPPDVVVEDAGRRSSLAAIVRRALAASTLRLIRHDAGVRLGEDPEDLHQARVATRRLRSDLRTLAAVLDTAWTTALRDELSWLGGELGPVRDADVLAARVRAAAAGMGEAAAGERLGGLLDAQAVRGRGRLLEAMRSRRYAELLDRLVEASARPALVTEGPAAELLPPLVAGPWSSLRRMARRLGPDSPDGELHRLRIRVKRCRYAVEAAAPAAGRPAQRLATRLARLQEALGEVHDAVIAGGWLREHAAEVDAFVAGQLCGLEMAAARAARIAWPSLWRRADRPALASWLR